MKIFVTGLGAVSCLGKGVAEHRSAYVQGISGVRSLMGHWQNRFPDSFGGKVDAESVDKEWADEFGTAQNWLAEAIGQALNDANVDDISDSQVFLGSAHGNFDVWQHYQRQGCKEKASGGMWKFDRSLPKEFGPGGAPVVVSTACTSSAVAVGLGLAHLKSGKSGLAIVAGVDLLTEFLQKGFESLQLVSKGICRPFDRDRDGLTLGEGAGAIVIETQAHLESRGGRPHAQLAGYGFGADAKHLIAPDPFGSGLERAIRNAFADANQSMDMGENMVVNAHGTGTKLNDSMELAVFNRIFSKTGNRINVTATKPLIGHLSGAAGIFEVIFSAISIGENTTPHVFGLENSEEKGDCINIIQDRPLEMETDLVLTVNSGFGGTNSAILLQGVQS